LGDVLWLFDFGEMLLCIVVEGVDVFYYGDLVCEIVRIVVVGGGKLMVDDFVVYWVGEVFCVVFGVVGIFVVVIL